MYHLTGLWYAQARYYAPDFVISPLYWIVFPMLPKNVLAIVVFVVFIAMAALFIFASAFLFYKVFLIKKYCPYLRTIEDAKYMTSEEWTVFLADTRFLLATFTRTQIWSNLCCRKMRRPPAGQFYNQRDLIILNQRVIHIDMHRYLPLTTNHVRSNHKWHCMDIKMYCLARIHMTEKSMR